MYKFEDDEKKNNANTTQQEWSEITEEKSFALLLVVYDRVIERLHLHQ